MEWCGKVPKMAETMPLMCDVWLQNTSRSVCKSWCSSSSVCFLPALYRRTKVDFAQMCVERPHRYTQTWWCIRRSALILPQNMSWSHTQIRKQALCPASRLAAPSQLLHVCLMCLGRAGESSLGCRRQVTRRRTAACDGVLGARSEDTVELSVDTLRGTQRRSRHTCKRKHKGVTHRVPLAALIRPSVRVTYCSSVISSQQT